MKRTVRTRRSNLASYIVRRCAFRPLRSIPSKDPFLPRCTPFQRRLRRRFCLAWRQSVRFFVLVDSCRCSVGTPTSLFSPSTRRAPAPVRVAFHEVRSRVESGRRASGLESASPSTFRCARIAVGVRDRLPVDFDACRPVHLAYPFGLVGIGFGLDASPSFVLLFVDRFRGAFLDSLSSFRIAWHLPHSGCLDGTDPPQHQPQAQEPVPSRASGLFPFPMWTWTFGFTTIGQGGAFRRRGWRTWVLDPPCRFHSGSILGGWGLGFGERDRAGDHPPGPPQSHGVSFLLFPWGGTRMDPPVPKERTDGGPPRSGHTHGRERGRGEGGAFPFPLWGRGWHLPIPPFLGDVGQGLACAAFFGAPIHTIQLV